METEKFDIDKVEIEIMQEKHLTEVFEIEEDSFSVPWSFLELKKEVTSNKMAIYIVATYNNHVVGYAGMWHIVTEGHITNVAVKEEFRRNKIGSLLVEELDKIALEKEMIGITLEVRISNSSAQKLYTSHGYKPEGFRKNYYSDTKEDAIIMWKHLLD